MDNLRGMQAPCAGDSRDVSFPRVNLLDTIIFQPDLNPASGRAYAADAFFRALCHLWLLHYITQ